MNYKWLIFVLLCYGVLGSLFALNTPSWQSPDEPAHYNVVRQMADGHWPVMAQGDYDEALRNEIVSSRFDSRFSIDSFTYEDWQPPLFYMLLTPIFALSGGSIVALRLTSLLIGAGVVVLAYLIALELYPRQPWLAWGTAVFVALLPQHLHILASVNNDSLAEFFIALILYLLLRAIKTPPEAGATFWIKVGVVLGLGYLTKGTVYVVSAVIFFIVLALYWTQWQNFIKASLRVFVPAFLLGSISWVRNLIIYDGFDPLAINAHDAVVTGQLRTADWLATQPSTVEAIRTFINTTFNSFWGQFGWMSAPFSGRIYQMLWAFTFISLVGVIIIELKPSLAPDKLPSNLARLLFGLMVGVALFLYLGYNATFVQHQGRYLFSALIPLSLTLNLGWSVLLLKVREKRPITAYLFPLALTLGLILLDLFGLYRIIIPHL